MPENTFNVNVINFVTDQELGLVFGFEHGGHLLQIPAVTLLLQVKREEDRDDPLCDVGQIEVIVPLHHTLHHFICTFTPADIIDSEQLKKTELFVGIFVTLFYLGTELLFFCCVDLIEPLWRSTRNIKQRSAWSAESLMLRIIYDVTHSPGPVKRYR